MSISPITALQSVLGYDFNDPALLETALTHRSYRNEHANVEEDNERLEFLGDAALGMYVARMVFRLHPSAGEGHLTRMRAELVCEEALSALAITLGVGPAMRLGKGEDQSGGREKARLLCSAFEAIIGSVFLDGGTEALGPLLTRLFESRLQQATAARDAKSELQERAQRVRNATPTYRLVDTAGPDHARVFHVAVLIGEEEVATGEGRSKARAEQAAAGKALSQLADLNDAPEVAEEDTVTPLADAREGATP